jgi:hypothetical protein
VVRHRQKLTVAQILAWADAHCGRAGRWPNARSGPVAGRNGETWRAIDHALSDGTRGLAAGSSLARLLAERRGVRNRADLPRLPPRQILAWADAYHLRTGQWPTRESGPVGAATGDSWSVVDTALRDGQRGLPGGCSLARLLAARRGVPNRLDKPRLRRHQILRWADAHRRRTGKWPHSGSGPVVGAPGETWKGVDLALRHGWRGLRRGLTLAALLARERKARNRANLAPLTERKILVWADEHYRLTGAWPTRCSGPVNGAPGETWCAVALALRGGYRGLPGGSSLAQLLHAKRRRPSRAIGRALASPSKSRGTS